MPASAATAISEQSQPALTLLLCLALSACVSDEAGRPVTATGLVDSGINTAVFDCETPAGASFEFTIRRGAAELALWLPVSFDRPYLVLSEEYVGTEFTGLYREADVSVDLADESVELRVGDQRFTGCRENRLRSVWEHAKLSGIDFRASGENPAWFLEIRDATHLEFRSALDPSVLRQGSTEFTRETSAGSASYRATGEAAGFAVEIGGGGCEVTDGLGLQGSAVTVSDQGRRFSGCGRPLH